jgi:hypothetical protein
VTYDVKELLKMKVVCSTSMEPVTFLLLIRVGGVQTFPCVVMEPSDSTVI